MSQRRLRIFEHISLDGVIQHALDHDFPYAGWFVPYMSPEGGSAVNEAQGTDFDLLLGRTTYDEWSKSWGKASGSPLAERFNAAVKFVVSHDASNMDWKPAVHMGVDLLDAVARLRSQEGPDLIVWGSSTLTSPLLEHGLVDELVLITYPVLLGAGRRLFEPGTAGQNLELVSSQSTPTGVLINSYRPTGPISLPR